MPTVVQINTVSVPSSSIGSVMHALQSRMQREGWSAHLVAGYGPGAHYTMQSGNAYRLNALRARLGLPDVCVALGTTKRLCRHLESVSPDIVHLHNAHGYYLHLPTLLEWLAVKRIPLAVTAHDQRMLTGRCAVPQACGLWKTRECHKCLHKDRYPASWIPDNVFYIDNLLSSQRTKIPVMIASPSRDIATSLDGVVIPNGVDKKVFCDIPKTTSLPDNDTVRCIAVATKWNAAKNGAALNALAAAAPQLLLTVVGEGFRALHPNITVIKHISQSSAMAQLLRDSHVLLSPSLTESFGLTVAEANACGIPAVINSEASLKPWYHPGNALEAPFSNPSAVLETVGRAVHLRIDTAAVPSVDSMTESYMSLYRQLLDSSLLS